MAIASYMELDSETPQVIFAVFQAPVSELPDLEKQMKGKDFVILQKKTLELSNEQMEAWFSHSKDAAEDLQYFGFALQRKDAEEAFKDFVSELNSVVCGQCDAKDEGLRELLPSVVMDQYLLDPIAASEYLNQIKPNLMEALKQICAEKPDDPVLRLAELLEKEASDNS